MRTVMGIDEVVRAWAEASQEHAHTPAHRLNYNGRIINSYSQPVGVRMERPDGSHYFLLNIDRWSSVTDRHQSAIRSYIQRGGGWWGQPNEGFPREHYFISFSALNNAGIAAHEIPDIEPIDLSPDKTWEEREPHYRCSRCGALQPDAAPCGSGGDHDFTHTVYRHIAGGMVFKITQEKYDYGRAANEEYTRYFLSAVDETGFNPASSYFLTELTRPVENLKDAYDSLKPERVLSMDVVKPGEIPELYFRQGEWFFIPASEEDATFTKAWEKELVREVKRTDKDRLPAPDLGGRFYWSLDLTPEQHRAWDVYMEAERPYDFARQNLNAVRGGYLPADQFTDGLGRTRTRTQNHKVTRVVKKHDGKLLVKGRVTHDNRDHRPLKLPEGQWFEALHNVQLASWSSGRDGRRGRID
jgi:hypothetical protein